MDGPIGKTTLGSIVVVAIALGLLGATVSGCDLTEPDNLLPDTQSSADSGRTVAQLDGTAPPLTPSSIRELSPPT